MALEQLNTRRTRALATHGAPIKYAADGKVLFQREAHVIRVINTKNGQILHECVRAEQPARPSNASSVKDTASEATTAVNVEKDEKRDQDARWDVTAIALNPYNALQLLAAYADGKILMWDFSDEKILQEFDAKAPILWMECSTVSPSMLMLVVASESDKWALVEFNMKKKRRARTLFEHSKTPFGSAAMQSYTALGREEAAGAVEFHGDYVVLTAGARLFTLQVHREQDGSAALGRVATITKLNHLRDVTCVALHPRTLEFSVGDALGQIFRFLKGGASDAKLHWHSHAVRCLTYSPDGNFLLSGGEENVLVSWHLESGRRAYLPRRSAPLTAIAARVDGTAGYAVTLQDNVLFQYNPITREEEWQCMGLARSGESATYTQPWREIVFDPLTHAIPLNGVSTAGMLQFYEPYKDRVLFSVPLTERNQVTRTEDEVMPQILAEQIAFSVDGMELVTLHRAVYPDEEEEEEEDDEQEQALRFWKRRENGSFYVHTAIDAPHGGSRVSAMAYSPSPYNECVVTGDVNGEFKVWKKTTVVTAASAQGNNPQKQQPQQITNEVSTTVWHCQSVVKFRESAISTIAFAKDGSLLAVAYGHLLTLWDISTMALRGVLSSADGQRIKRVLFPSASSPYVVVLTDDELQVWNLLTLSLWWRYVISSTAQCLLSPTKPGRDEFVVALQIEKEYVVLVFKPESAVPVQIQRVPFSKVESTDDIWSLTVHPKHGELVIVDTASNLWRMGDAREDTRAERRAQDVDADEAVLTPLAAMFKQARREFQSKRQQQQKQSREVTSDGTAALFDAPAHVLPSMTSLYRSFMDKMMAKPSSTAQDGEQDASKKNKKKQSKKRKKANQSAAADEEPVVTTKPQTEGDAQAAQKRVKAMVEKEIANPQRQRANYSTLLAAFKKNKQQNKPPAAKA
ncbi:hypothetical protein Poli38472_001183 [Pythium oligandrum]|uniref:WD repeat-containing protein 75 second beta-propeller domain-containing protein n=1 Tax=Pythium oligandrum TaxID=41045 RepID=A0A8K1CUE5_PYTOL|nr:hypothetical protein Poli38472_001183 [Pythium oligandrum]|eukprot:TMW69027.1 hypothetical protein Poli38472_001183 [Pythium oligandrum]